MERSLLESSSIVNVNRIRAVAACLLLSFAAPSSAVAADTSPPTMIVTRAPDVRDVRDMLRPRLDAALSRTESPLALAAGPKDIGLVKTVVVLALVVVVVVVVGGVVLIANAAD
jgi:hypothetical protein